MSGMEPGMIFRHYKGGLYTIVAVGLMEDTLKMMVAYRSNKKGTVWFRTLENFTQLLIYIAEPQGYGHKDSVQRFTRVQD